MCRFTTQQYMAACKARAVQLAQKLPVIAIDGVDVLGMTGMPEAVLARELKMAYAHFCSVSSIDCFDSGVGTDGCDEQTSMAMTKIRQLLNGL